MLALALALRARGHAVSFLVPDNFVAWVRAHQFEAIGNGIDVRQLLHDAGARVDSVRWQVRHFKDVMIPRLFASFAGAPDADLIVGAGVQLAAASVAEARGVPFAMVGFCPCLVPSGSAPPPLIHSQWLPAWVNRAIWSVGRPVVDFALARLLNRHRRALGLRADVEPLETILSDRLIIAADHDLAPLPDDAPVRAAGTDAWVLDDEEALEPRVEHFLNADPPPVYVGFGSMVAARAAELGRQAVAAVRAVGSRVLVAGGWAELDRHLAGDEDVLVAPSLPHAAVLPRVAAVVHHGGAGTTTAAARAGRPQVLLPHILDQFYWARRIEVLGLGPSALPVSIVTADVLADRIDRAVNDPRIGSRAAAFGSMIAGRNGVDDAVELLEAIVDCGA